MHNQSTDNPLLEPPVELPGFHKNDWFEIPVEDPTIDYLVRQLWDQPQQPDAWEAARLSKAVYLYREKVSRWTVLVKFYSAKTGSASSAERYAANEFKRTQELHSLDWKDKSVPAPRTLALYRGALFLEYINGLTLEDTIAIRRNRPGTLLPALEKTARLLSELHSQCAQPAYPRNFHYEIADTTKYVKELAHKGVLEGNQVVADALYRQIDCWSEDPVMIAYIPASIHGDATTSNFVIPWDGGLIAIDWERMWTADPASELGRFTAEVSHSVQRYGGDNHEAQQLLKFITQTYCQGLPSDWDAELLLQRMRFYQASSTLRIARNGWLPRLLRTELVLQALSLLI